MGHCKVGIDLECGLVFANGALHVLLVTQDDADHVMQLRTRWAESQSNRVESQRFIGVGGPEGSPVQVAQGVVDPQVAGVLLLRAQHQTHGFVRCSGIAQGHAEQPQGSDWHLVDGNRIRELLHGGPIAAQQGLPAAIPPEVRIRHAGDRDELLPARIIQAASPAAKRAPFVQCLDQGRKNTAARNLRRSLRGRQGVDVDAEVPEGVGIFRIGLPAHEEILLGGTSPLLKAGPSPPALDVGTGGDGFGC